MKKLILIFAGVLMFSCQSETKKYVTVKGKLKNAEISNLTIMGQNFKKEIKVDENGTFSDTLKVTDGIHGIATGNDRAILFLKNGYNLNLEFKGDKISEGIAFTGIGAETNNFLDKKRAFYMSDLANPKMYFKLDKEAFDLKLEETKKVLKGYKDEFSNLDSLIDAMDAKNDKMFFEYIAANYDKMHISMEKLGKGKPSPTFSKYVNYKGGTSSLDDFKGNYVYIDVWATWCGPCKAEIPYLKKMEKEYHGKNITFVSVSVDKEAAFEGWKQMIKDKEMSGVQLFADNNFESKFITDYGINAIPRFILLDPQGNIVDADTYRPSNPKLKELFNELGI